MSRYWSIVIVLSSEPFEADTAPEVEQQVRDNIRDYLQPSNVVSIDAERIGFEELREWAP